MRKRTFSAGETIFLEGDASDEAYILHSGRVEVLRDTPKGQVRLAVLGEGDVLGEMGLLDERPRSATARVLDTVVVDCLRPTELMQMLRGNPQSLSLLRALFERLRTTNRMVAEYATASPSPPKIPKVSLLAKTAQTRTVISEGGIEVTRFPFRIGRKSDNDDVEALTFNEIELTDQRPYALSLNHFAIDLGGNGVIVRDRGSQLGTVVNDTLIGATAKLDLAPLRQGENLVIAGAPLPGRSASPFQFVVIVE
jgi:CRP-like cAMP-binding protein